MAKLTGTNPDQVPTNADLGTMAYQDATDVKLESLRVEGDSGSIQARLGTSDGYLEVNSFSSNPTYVVFGGSNITQGSFGTQGNIDLSFMTNNTESMRITSSGNVGIGDQNPDSHYGAEHRLVVRDNQDGPTQAVVTNSNVSGSASSVYKWITGTGNSYMTHTLHDGNGTPFARLSMGTAVINYDIFIDNTQAFLIRGSNKEVVIPSGKLELDGNDIGGTQVTIADDAVASITPPRKGGFMMMTYNGNTDYPLVNQSAMIYYDVGASLQIQECNPWGTYTFGSSDVDVSTSNVTGTTGTDSNTTVAVQSGVIKIENRSGGNAHYQITFL